MIKNKILLFIVAIISSTWYVNASNPYSSTHNYVWSFTWSDIAKNFFFTWSKLYVNDISCRSINTYNYTSTHFFFRPISLTPLTFDEFTEDNNDPWLIFQDTWYFYTPINRYYSGAIRVILSRFENNNWLPAYTWSTYNIRCYINWILYDNNEISMTPYENVQAYWLAIIFFIMSCAVFFIPMWYGWLTASWFLSKNISMINSIIIKYKWEK